MFALLSSRPGKSKPKRLIRKRVVKTPGQLYLVLSQEFERLRSPGCSCRMPTLFARTRPSAEDSNWQVEPLWYGCASCQQLVEAVACRNAALYDVQEADGPDREEPLGGKQLGRFRAQAG